MKYQNSLKISFKHRNKIYKKSPKSYNKKMENMLGDYKIITKIGAGGQGKVSLGKHTTRMGDYVVKQFDDLEVGRHELDILQKLSPLCNDNIVKCYNFLPDYSQKNEIVLEYCPEGSINDKIKSCIENAERFPEILILSWLIQIVNGLEAIHSKNIIHQDIKPDNILIGFGGILKITDFGASRIVDSPKGCSNDILGSLYYYSPEALKYGRVSMKSDIWSLGVLAYELCCLRHPYEARDTFGMKFLHFHQYYFPFPIPKEYSKDLDKIIKSMLQKDPENRPELKHLKGLLQIAKAKHLNILIKKYQTIGVEKNSLINILNHTTNPYSLTFFLNQKITEELFDTKHCYRRYYNQIRKTTNIVFFKSGGLIEIFFESENQTYIRKLFKDGRIAESREEVIYIEPKASKILDVKLNNHHKTIRKCKAQTKLAADDSIYEGEFINNKANGPGILYFPNGTRFEGEFKNDKRNGKGIQYSPEGDKFEAEYIDNKVNGYGIQYFADGSKFEGEFINNEKNGFGIMNWVNGMKYEGEFKNDKMNGTGTLFYNNGDIFEGEFKDNKRNGHGKICFEDGIAFEGEYRDDQRNGHGKIYCEDGIAFEGEYRDDQRNGYGIEYFANGCQYEGEYKDDKRNGKGVMKFENGNRFEGMFKDNQRDGHGVEYFVNGAKFEGEFKDDQRNGYGIEYFANGDISKGELKNNKRNGKGAKYFVNGDIFEREFKDDGINEYGKLYYVNGQRLEGEFKDGKINGKGIMHLVNGDKIEGIFIGNAINGNVILSTKEGNKYEAKFVSENELGIMHNSNAQKLWINSKIKSTVGRNAFQFKWKFTGGVLINQLRIFIYNFVNMGLQNNIILNFIVKQYSKII